MRLTVYYLALWITCSDDSDERGCGSQLPLAPLLGAEKNAIWFFGFGGKLLGL